MTTTPLQIWTFVVGVMFCVARHALVSAFEGAIEVCLQVANMRGPRYCLRGNRLVS